MPLRWRDGSFLQRWRPGWRGEMGAEGRAWRSCSRDRSWAGRSTRGLRGEGLCPRGLRWASRKLFGEIIAKNAVIWRHFGRRARFHFEFHGDSACDGSDGDAIVRAALRSGRSPADSAGAYQAGPGAIISYVSQTSVGSVPAWNRGGGTQS